MYVVREARVHDMNRRRVAEARSRRASKGELREARLRLKEIDEELRQIELLPETKAGEERELRYQRVLRLRAMRDEFQAQFPARPTSQGHSILISLVMTIASLALCAFCVGSGYVGLTFLNQKPDPTTTADGFWQAMSSQQYTKVHETYFSSILRTQLLTDSFVTESQQADQQYGPITAATLETESGDLKTAETLTYSVHRGKTVYNVTLKMQMHLNAWTITDLGAAIAPSEAGAPTPTPPPAPTADTTATTGG